MTTPIRRNPLVLLTTLALCALAAALALPNAGPSAYRAMAALPAQDAGPNPATLPFPADDVERQAEDRTMLIDVAFRGRDNMQVTNLRIVPGQARGNQGDAPLLALVMRDRGDRVLGEINAWHPLWAHVWEPPPPGSEFVPHTERVLKLQEATGTFVLPFDPRVHRIEVLDQANDRAVVGQVDVAPVVRAYCQDHPDDEDCGDLPPTVLFVDPVESTVAIGDRFTVTLRAQNADALYGGQLQMTFDPAVIQVEDADPGRPGAQLVPGDFPTPDVVFRNAADNGAGRLSYYFSLQGEKPGVSGDGVVAQIGLRAVGEGQSLIGFAQAILSDPGSRAIPAQGLNALVTVEVGGLDVDGTVRLERRDSGHDGARVCVGDNCTETDAAGNWQLDAVPPGALLTVQHPSYLRAERTLPATLGDHTLPELTLIAGDLDQNDVVDLPDAVMIGQRFDLGAGDPLWLSACDINDDAAINILDMVAVQFNLRRRAPSPWSGADVLGLRLDDGPRTASTMLARRNAEIDATQQAARLRLSPSRAVASGLGETLSLDLLVDDVTNLYGLRVRLAFDPAVLQVRDASPGAGSPGIQVAIGEFLDPIDSFVLLNEADNTAGTIDLAITQTRPATARSGSGTIATITFRTTGAGESGVTFDEFLLSDDALPAPKPIAVEPEGATVVVEGGGYRNFLPILARHAD